MAIPPAIEAALRAGDRLTASRLARAEVARSPDDIELLQLAAYHCIHDHELDEAQTLLDRALALAPSDAGILNSLGNLYRRRGDIEKARTLFLEACERDPANTATRFNLAQLLEDIGENADAKVQYEAIIERAPNDVEALWRLFYFAAVEGEYDKAIALGQRALGPDSVFGNLAKIALQRGDYIAARNFGEEAVACGPSPRAITTLAHAEFRSGDPARAGKRLEYLLTGQLSSEDRAFALSLLADILDKVEQPGFAFQHYAQSKAILAQFYAPQYARPGQRTGRMLADDLRSFFENRQLPRLTGSAPDGGRPAGLKGHVFLVGFPRSGTTLLEQSLAMHPDLYTLDETGPLMRTSWPLWSTPDALQTFANADQAELSKHRAAYWSDLLAKSPNLNGKILVDKMPLNCILMAHIDRLFPDAKIIFAVRDPRDVVFSCFRTRFVMTAFMYEFCTPLNAARFYNSVMSLTDVYRKSATIPVFQSRYEDVVQDFEGVVKSLCEFLGITPVDGMMRPEERARARMVNTPSGPQIARGLYDGSKQWRRYEAQLTDIFPLLEPWVRRFGYN